MKTMPLSAFKTGMFLRLTSENPILNNALFFVTTADNNPEAQSCCLFGQVLAGHEKAILGEMDIGGVTFLDCKDGEFEIRGVSEFEIVSREEGVRLVRELAKVYSDVQMLFAHHPPE